jgi:hypothetical protein
MTESELIQAKRASGRTRKWQVGGLRYRRKREGAEDRAPSPRRTTPLTPGSYLRSRIVKGVAVMKLEEYDFTRNPIVENQTFFLESKCVHCGFAVLGSSLEELLKEEDRHRAQCMLKRAAS